MISWDMIIVGATFYLLLGATLFTKPLRQKLLERQWQEWILDMSGLFMQGLVVPLAKTFLVIGGLRFFAPQWEGAFSIHPVFGFLLSFVVVDYIYYWNHRLFHKKSLWPIHALHHSPKKMDLFITSRNALWTPFFIIYIWFHALIFFLLENSTWYFIGVGLTSALDLWRHTEFSPKKQGSLWKALSYIFITPLNHAWHHSSKGNYCNFGANFCLWDKWHGTYLASDHNPERIGLNVATNMKSLFIFSGK